MLVTALLLGGYSLLIIKYIKPDLLAVQAGWMIAGLAVYIISRRINTGVFRALWPILYFGSLVVLILVLFGPEVRGTHRWLEIFNQRLQPAELVKPLIIASVAGFLSGRSTFRLRDFLYYLGLFLPIAVLVFKEPDLGNALVFMFMFAVMLLISPFKIRYYVLPTLVIAMCAPILWNHLAEYQKLRFVTFLNPTFDVQGAGYNGLQALIAVGSGGLFGHGLGAGTQSSLRFLPEFHTDFIFASTVEQLGFAGGIVLLILYVVLLAMILRSARKSDTFHKFLCYGVFAVLFFQVAVNIGMNMAVLPITGITLPLFSFGGSSIISTFMAIGMVAGSLRRKDDPIAIR